jgi:hypothetical protein
VSPDPEVSPSPEVSPDGEPTDAGGEAPAPDASKFSADGCPEGFSGNHGQYVSTSDDKNEAAHSTCGKPVKPEKEKPKDSPKDSEDETDDEEEGSDG